MKTRTEQAVAFFSSVPRAGNCAQCVAKAFADDDVVMKLASCGAGNAPMGLCGALYAALSLADEKDREEIRRAFQERTGSDLCRELKSNYKIPSSNVWKSLRNCLKRNRINKRLRFF